MNEEVKPGRDPVWAAAWSWVSRQHEPVDLDAEAQAELARWLAADAAHHKAYDEAARLWLIAGLVPPRNDIEIPGAAAPEDER